MKFRQIEFSFLAICLVCGLLSCCREETLLPDLEERLVGYVFTLSGEFEFTGEPPEYLYLPG